MALHFPCVYGDWDDEFNSVLLSRPYKGIREVFREEIINFNDYNIVDGTILKLGIGYDEETKAIKYFILNGNEIEG